MHSDWTGFLAWAASQLKYSAPCSSPNVTCIFCCLKKVVKHTKSKKAHNVQGAKRSKFQGLRQMQKLLVPILPILPIPPTFKSFRQKKSQFCWYLRYWNFSGEIPIMTDSRDNVRFSDISKISICAKLNQGCAETQAFTISNSWNYSCEAKNSWK